MALLGSHKIYDLSNISPSGGRFGEVNPARIKFYIKIIDNHLEKGTF